MPDIRPQRGPQEAFLSTPADIAIYGGAAGGGKTYALLMEPLRHIGNARFGAVIFRRETPQITNQGGLWDTSTEIYAGLGARPKLSPYLWTFAGGARVEFHHLQYESTVQNWQGAQIALIGFDELTHFTRTQFFYMLSRNRSLCGVRPYIRATCNPDPDSWVREFISWWIDNETGLAIPERSGVLRWFVRYNDEIHWADSPEGLAHFGSDHTPKSVTFIAASIHDNPILLESDPGYLANLQALPRHERERLERGNWNARPAAGVLFARSDFEIIEVAPRLAASVRYWDRAATTPSESNPDPDWTAGVNMGRTHDGQYVITDIERFRARALDVRRRIRAIGSQEPARIVIEEDPGQAGKAEADDLIRFLAGMNVSRNRVTKRKYERWLPFAAQCQAGNVLLVRGEWNEPFITEMVALTDNPKDYGHDDQADAATGAFSALVVGGGAPSASREMRPVTAGMREDRW